MNIQITALNAFEVELQQLSEEALTKNNECKMKYPDREEEFEDWAVDLKGELADVMAEIEKERGVSMGNVETPTGDEHMVFTSPAEAFTMKQSSVDDTPSWVSAFMNTMSKERKEDREFMSVQLKQSKVDMLEQSKEDRKFMVEQLK